MEYPLASKVMDKSFYVDGADSMGKVVKLQYQLQFLFDKGDFALKVIHVCSCTSRSSCLGVE